MFQYVVSLPHRTGLPRDVTVNTFAFVQDDVADCPEVFDRLEEFYNDDAPTDAICRFLSPAIDRNPNIARIEAYRLSDSPPRVPVATRLWQLGVQKSGDPLPAEVALCASFQAPAVSGFPQARRRGRIFLGPFVDAANDDVVSVGRSVPSSDLIETVANASERLAAYWTVGGPNWAVWSRRDDTMYEVTNGWVDNDWDTQRRREPSPTGRISWTTSP